MFLRFNAREYLERALNTALEAKSAPTNIADTFRNLLPAVLEGRASPRDAAQKMLLANGDYPIAWLFHAMTQLVAALPRREDEWQKRLMVFMDEIAKAHDTNQQKLKEEMARLQAQAEQLTPFFHNALEGCLLADERGKIIAVNDALANLIHETKEKLQGRPWLELLHAEERAKWHHEQRIGESMLANQKPVRLALNPTSTGMAISILDFSAERAKAKQL